jgi:hypothetical protein
VVFSITAPCLAFTLTASAAPGAARLPAALSKEYGSNQAAGATFTYDGVTLYYEIHGNSGDRDEPHIRPEALEAISAPTLVLAGDLPGLHAHNPD